MKLLLLAFLILFEKNGSNSSINKTAALYKLNINTAHAVLEIKRISRIEKLREKYDTLIPIFDGLFITYHKINHASFRTLKKIYRQSDSMHHGYMKSEIKRSTKKWGVIDSTGDIVVPFMCDAVKAICKDTGVASIFYHTFSLNTGVPRYKYLGRYFYFNKNGRIPKAEEGFNITVMSSDFHHEKFIIDRGPNFYLPNEYP